MSDRPAVLFVNQAFYDAFRARDLATMDALWSHDEPVTCIHPGWRALEGRDDVMESWEGILTGDSAPDIICRNAEAHLLGDLAYVICYEVIGNTVLVATNVLRRSGGGWLLVHHQAGPCDLPPDLLESDEQEGSALQ